VKSDLLLAVTQLAAERALPHGVVLSAIQDALVSAYKRDAISEGQGVTVVLDPDTGEMEVHTVRTVVEDGSEMEEPAAEVYLTDAIKIDETATWWSCSDCARPSAKSSLTSLKTRPARS
jgi:N utilization substance protein A